MKDHSALRMNRALLTALQRGVPLVRRPWAAMAGTLGMTEAEVLQAARDLFARGVARRFGAIFDSRYLGYDSTLCAVEVPLRDIERLAALLQPHPGVTHCYEREGRPNLWFTLTAPADRLDDELLRMGAVLKPYPLLNLPAVRRFKVEVVLGAADATLRSGDSSMPCVAGFAEQGAPCYSAKSAKAAFATKHESLRSTSDDVGPASRCVKRDGDVCHRRIPPKDGHACLRRKILPDAANGDTPPVFSAREKSLIRRIQGNLPVAEEPFTSVAQELKWDPDDLLQRLASWKQAGILRRIGFILRHRAAGFVANGMCVWPVVEADLERAGRLLADSPEVSHCYERPSSPSFPFNLFAMIHARERGVAEDTFRRLSKLAALAGGRMLISLREFKKSSPVFFLEDSPRRSLPPLASAKPPAEPGSRLGKAPLRRDDGRRSLGAETGGKAPT